MGYILKFVDILYGLLVLLAKILLVIMILVVSTAVFFRFVLNRGIKWSDEVALLTMVWFTFIGLVIGIKNDLHISIEVIASLFPSKVNRVIDKYINLICAFLGIMLAVFGYKLVGFTMTSTLPATGLPSATLYGVVPVSGIFVTYYSIIKFLGLDKKYGSKGENLPGGGTADA